MALHKHKGEWYCEAADLGLPETVLKARLYRGRKGQGGIQNITNPFYHGSNSKRLVLLSNLSSARCKRVIDRLGEAILMQVDKVPPLRSYEPGASGEG